MFELKAKSIRLAVRTRAQRRNAVTAVVRLLMEIRAAELGSLANVPANLSLAHNCIIGHIAVEDIECALNTLVSAYDAELSRISDYASSFGEVPF